MARFVFDAFILFPLTECDCNTQIYFEVTDLLIIMTENDYIYNFIIDAILDTHRFLDSARSTAKWATNAPPSTRYHNTSSL